MGYHNKGDHTVNEEEKDKIASLLNDLEKHIRVSGKPELVVLEKWIKAKGKPDFRESKKALLSLAARIESSTLEADVKRELKPHFNSLAESLKNQNIKTTQEDIDNLLDIFNKKLGIKVV